ncbi:MAG: LptF/LptG family permease, partial [Candidatus Portiera sp.]|nr:LptF/LptG family permease [Portiera sp.]
MLKIIDAYIISRVARALIASAVFLTLFVAILTMINELNLRGTDSFLLIALELVPFIIYDMLPLACVIGVVIAMQSMINKNELVVIKELGMGKARIIFLVSLVAFIAGVLAYLWVDFVAVPLHKISEDKLQKEETSVRGIWLNSGNQLIYIDRMNLASAENDAEAIAEGDVRIFEFADGSLASYQRGLGVKFNDEKSPIATNLLSWRNGLMDILTDSNYPLKIDPRELIASVQNTRSQNVLELWRGRDSIESLGVSSKARSYEIWDRVSKPTLFVSLALLMLAFCLSIPPRASMVLLVIVSIAIGILTGTIFRSIALYVAVAQESYLWLGALGPPFILAC